MKKRINSIDSLKGLACLVIAFLWHYLNMQPKGKGEPLQFLFGVFYDYGQYFVELFFMISGFVMAYCYKERIEQGEDFIPYIKKRLKHLYPPFFTTLMAVLVLQTAYYAINGEFYVYIVSAWHFVLNVLCIQTGWLTTDQSFNGPAWCISVELFLYILFYISTRACHGKKNKYLLTSGIISLISLVVIYLGGGSYPILNMFMMRGVCCFYIGALLCSINDLLDEVKKKRIAVGLLLFLVLFRIILFILPDVGFWDSESTGQLMLILMEWPILIFAAINCWPLRKVLEIRPLRFLGAISLDVFLWHIPVQLCIKVVDSACGLNLDYGSIPVWIFYIAAVLVISSVSFFVRKKHTQAYYIEKSVLAAAGIVIVLWATDLAGIRMKPVLDNSLSYSDMSSVITLEPGVSLSEDFRVLKKTDLKKIQFYTITWGRQYSDEQLLHITLRDDSTDEEIYTVDRYMNYFQDGRSYEIPIDESIILEEDTEYTIEFTSNTNEGQETMAMMMTNTSGNDERTYVNGNESNQHISAKLWGKGK